MAARDGRLESEWWHTAQLLAQFHNAHREKGKSPVDAARFNPFAKPVEVPKRPATQEDLDMLFGPRKTP
jgi:hypothetical protein